jgi:hypothetical protein
MKPTTYLTACFSRSTAACSLLSICCSAQQSATVHSIRDAQPVETQVSGQPAMKGHLLLLLLSALGVCLVTAVGYAVAESVAPDAGNMHAESPLHDAWRSCIIVSVVLQQPCLFMFSRLYQHSIKRQVHMPCQSNCSLCTRSMMRYHMACM